MFLDRFPLNANNEMTLFFDALRQAQMRHSQATAANFSRSVIPNPREKIISHTERGKFVEHDPLIMPAHHSSRALEDLLLVEMASGIECSDYVDSTCNRVAALSGYCCQIFLTQLTPQSLRVLCARELTASFPVLLAERVKQLRTVPEEIIAALSLLGLPLTSPLSVLAVEVLPGPFNFTGDFARCGAVFQAGAAATIGEQEDPLGTQLGARRILRSSPLTPVPAIC